MVMSLGMGDVLCERLAALWRRIENAHYSYLGTDDSPDKLQRKQLLEEYIIEYLSLVPHENKFGLSETGKVFQRTLNELPEFSAYRAGLGWAALARYAANLMAQPWRKEYKVIRLYCGYYKHEVEANMVGAEALLLFMGYKSIGGGRLALDAPICPDTVAAVSRDALIAQCECQIMSSVWESVWSSGARVSWCDVARERVARASGAAAAAAALLARRDSNPLGYSNGSEIYSNVPVTVENRNRYHQPCSRMYPEEMQFDEPMAPMIHPTYVIPNPSVMPQQMMYNPHMHPDVSVTVTNSLPMMSYGIPFNYYPVQPQYMIPAPVYAPIKHAATVPVNGYLPMPQYRYPAIPTGQLIELDTTYENGSKEDRRKSRQDSSWRNSTSKSNFSDVSLPSLPRSDTQPTLSKAKEDGMGTYESWDYVYRNLSSKEQDGDRSRYSPSLDRDSRTLDRLDKEERRTKYQPTTLDLEDGLQALTLDRTYDDDVYRTAKVNENLMRMKQEQESKVAKQLARKEERKPRKLESIVTPRADALITQKVAPDKVKLLTKKDIKERKDVIRQQSMNGSVVNSAEVKKARKPTKHGEVEKTKRPLENGHNTPHSSKSMPASSSTQLSYDHKAQLVVSLDEPDHARRSPPKHLQNGDRDRDRDRDRPAGSTPTHHDNDRPDTADSDAKRNRWECSTCTYLNRGKMAACEMCNKSRLGEIRPLTSGGRECPKCTLVNRRDATACEACDASLQHCPTYI